MTKTKTYRDARTEDTFSDVPTDRLDLVGMLLRGPWRHYEGSIAQVRDVMIEESTGNILVAYQINGLDKVRPLHEWLGTVPPKHDSVRYARLKDVPCESQ